MQFKASAPGSLMLLGEYAVLSGKQALVCAVNKRIMVTLTPRTDDLVQIISKTHGTYVTSLRNLEIKAPYHYVLAVLKHFHPRLRTGCHIEIETEFSDQIGFGSSAAVTAALMSALVTWLGLHISPLDLVREGKAIIKMVQGKGSGADIAASLYGGMVSYQTQPLFAEKINVTHPISVIYSGYKTKTAEAIKQVETQFAPYPALLNGLYNAIGQCAIEGIRAARKKDWPILGNMMERQQGLMEALGVSSTILRDLIKVLREQPTILGAKISGSGLGDCVIGLGALAHDEKKISLSEGSQPITVEMTLQGAQCEKI